MLLLKITTESAPASCGAGHRPHPFVSCCVPETKVTHPTLIVAIEDAERNLLRTRRLSATLTLDGLAASPFGNNP